MDRKFIKQIGEKDFVLFEGLLNAFHENGGKKIVTEIISTEPFIIQATAKGENGTYQGIGDADESNVNRMIANHKIRMAETRAVARALRLYNNVGMCSADELGGDDAPQTFANNQAINLLKVELKKAGAKDETQALEMIENKSGVRLKQMSDLTNEQAKQILDEF